mmetsp:Transcript_4826/g.7905  ORF Transcript_4826/g.7905 Transcript_4826/m.7905 type:complete len:193 (-) Transcript_4826:48-626(-)|eukprot:CAMPEP_0205906672 /NCGR_PEP_ID=MMETSP1325-20131115/2071_1 /ASSEMBLY_ACC=CAM_ASM_000708 /TAXON_ID=236786 /ORGANISM="Florenciella sp., Strain RCC1007" /LENGTH=192 /DNA_ID=CAMNT_0053272695 /DNA_START=171 /DNA_END=749 /DNA_ORIENTATION=+
MGRLRCWNKLATFVDNEVLVFAKIFRKELQPSFRRAQTKLKNTVPSLIQTYREAKVRAGVGRAWPPSNTTALPTVEYTDVGLDECSYVFKYLFSPREAHTLVELLVQLVDTSAEGPTTATATPPQQAEVLVPTRMVSYATLIELLLDFQLQKHLVRENQPGWPGEASDRLAKRGFRSPKGRTLSPGRSRAPV